MTKDDIIRMAREAGPLTKGPFDDWCDRFANLVAEREREACATVCESEWSNVAEEMYGKELAAAIRARGTT